MTLSVHDFETAARAKLDPVHADFIAGGARDEITVRANEAAFGRLQLLPRVLRGSAERDLDVTLLGGHARLPILLSPTAFHKLVTPEGELATARAAADAGAIMIVSMASTVSVGDIADAARAASEHGDPPPLWFQLYIQPDPDITEALVRRATDAGCTALVVTVDSPVLGAHERNRRNGFHDLPAGLRCENLVDLRDGESGHVRQIAMSPELNWEHIDWLRSITSLPILLKGVLHPEDVRLALRHRVDGLLLSNHGGRQLDTVPATLELLPEIAAAVAGRIPIVLDGGVRRGTDVVKALALGASGVGIGRPVMWALAEGGEKGVRRLLELLREELDDTLALCGATGLHDLTPDLVRFPAWGPGWGAAHGGVLS
ncbi:alpha-hydroxy-acid oxidizing protein [Streptomyces sp. HC44]|uniref:Alpha-hydroxy-acid oxidizing protein n=1 Tax=Streptomyces scabichelini TaxID=2711217 RepID=A0A6G4V610_9ACTN|nr:alpha-hydroxy acid oxidase [Streptomyces scabichelini]NGO09273.1 alpha-hydroxy-acid oxidizing protein [Streptomyces scabichelini]